MIVNYEFNGTCHDVHTVIFHGQIAKGFTLRTDNCEFQVYATRDKIKTTLDEGKMVFVEGPRIDMLLGFRCIDAACVKDCNN